MKFSCVIYYDAVIYRNEWSLRDIERNQKGRNQQAGPFVVDLQVVI